MIYSATVNCHTEKLMPSWIKKEANLFLLCLTIFWTIAVLSSLIWNVIENRHAAENIALNHARESFKKDILARRWNASHGGVYVLVTEKTQPNPYLSFIPERDIITPSGRSLTLINPAYMTRQLHELSLITDKVAGHITSLKPVRPENRPDDWETKALRSFEKGETEAYTVIELEGKDYLRLMRPLLTEKVCLKCHGQQGYSEGMVRGGISVIVPMPPGNKLGWHNNFALFGGHFLLWGIGLLVLTFAGKKINTAMHRYQQARNDLAELNRDLEIKVRDRTTEYKRVNENLQLEIIERQKTERALHESEKKLKNVFDTSIPICITDTDYEIILSNDSYKNIFARNEQSEPSVKCYESRPSPICHTDACPMKRILNGEKEVLCEPSKTNADGSKQYFIVTARPLLDDKEIVGGIVECFQDISEKKRAETRLSEETQRLMVTLKSIGDGVITTDTQGRIVLINKVAETLTGWNSEKAVGKPLPEVFNIINKTTREYSGNPVEKVMAAGKIINLANHTVLISRDGTERDIADSGAPIWNKENQIIGVVLVFRDVTEKNRMEAELLKVKKLESVGVLAGGIAHDFNNILMAILGNLSLATQYVNSEEKAYPLLVKAEKASLRAKDLTQQLLTFAKGGEPVKETASIQEVIKDSASFVLHGGKVDCQYHIPNDLWFVEIDKGQMSQVIQNLIINASHAMPEGGIIEITCENISKERMADSKLAQKDHIKITISDSGFGIPENLIDKIFDPYFSTKQTEGSGLGLAISHSIITKHNGHISVKSTPDVGTTFTIYLPASAHLKKQEKREETITVHKGKVKIMVMDDEELVRDVTQSMLSLMGYEVVLVQDGTEALKLYREHSDSGEPIDITIMDLTIPGGMGGKDAVKEILAFDPDAKVIVSSGYSNDPIMANCQKYGFCAAIVKPYQLQELTKVINQVLA